MWGNHFQGPNGTLQLTIAGASSGQYDYLNVSGTAALGDTLKLVNQGFTPQAGETLSLVKGGVSIIDGIDGALNFFNDRFDREGCYRDVKGDLF